MTDEEYCDSKSKIEYYESVIRYIDAILKSIDNRGWDIKNSQQWKIFVAGGF